MEEEQPEGSMVGEKIVSVSVSVVEVEVIVVIFISADCCTSI